MSQSNLSRRDLLRTASLGVAGAVLSPLAASAQKRQSPYGPFKMGIQSYSLRNFKVDEALAKTQELGLTYWEAYSAHVPLVTDPVQVQAILAKLKAANVKLLGHGVTSFGMDTAKNRQVFEAAKALGVETISADPDPKAFDLVEALTEEFKINIGIHNHGPGHRWDKLSQVADALKGRSRRMGVVADLGHFLRSGENSVQVVEVLADRVHGIHLKDVKDKTKFTILGKGDMDVVGVLKALRAIKFTGVLALEYEENPQNPMPDIQECLAVVREAVQKL